MVKHTVALLGRSRGRLLSDLRSLRSLGSRCAGLAAELGGELLSTVLHGAELVLKGMRRAVAVKRRHELVGFVPKVIANECKDAGHGFEANGLAGCHHGRQNSCGVSG